MEITDPVDAVSICGPMQLIVHLTVVKQIELY